MKRTRARRDVQSLLSRSKGCRWTAEDAYRALCIEAQEEGEEPPNREDTLEAFEELYEGRGGPGLGWPKEKL